MEAFEASHNSLIDSSALTLHKAKSFNNQPSETNESILDSTAREDRREDDSTQQ